MILLNALPGVQREHPDEAVAVKIIGREAGERWKSMSNEDKEPYETLSNASKAEYARMKQLTPAERIMVLAAQAMHQPVRCIRACVSHLLTAGAPGSCAYVQHVAHEPLAAQTPTA